MTRIDARRRYRSSGKDYVVQDGDCLHFKFRCARVRGEKMKEGGGGVAIRVGTSPALGWRGLEKSLKRPFGGGRLRLKLPARPPAGACGGSAPCPSLARPPRRRSPPNAKKKAP